MSVDQNLILLFFKDFEKDSYIPGDRHVKRLLRPIYSRLRKKHSTSGFAVWCELLKRSLREQGYDVHLNNYKLAEKNPDQPVGLVGYPSLLAEWSLPNPAVLGPALLDHPAQNPTLMHDPRYKRYIVTCQWMYDQFAPVYGEDKTVLWYAGMDLKMWPDRREAQKTTDVLIYDKIRWRRDHYVPTLLEPIRAALDERGLTHETIQYHHYVHEMYGQALKRSRSMIFLCEHETQGMAYQEALASNVPVLAWDQGEWLDPNRPNYSPTPIAATSVPYFSETLCGDRFANIEDFATAFDRFWSKLDSYEPRQFVKDSLSFKGSADIYAETYFNITKTPPSNDAVAENPRVDARSKQAIN